MKAGRAWERAAMSLDLDLAAGFPDVDRAPEAAPFVSYLDAVAPSHRCVAR